MSNPQPDFRQYSIHQLIEVIDQADAYKAEVVAEAQQELQRRNPAPDVLAQIRMQAAAKQIGGQSNFPEGNLAKGNELLQNLLPFQIGKRSDQSVFLLVGAYFILVSLYQVYQDASFWWLNLSSPMSEWDLSLVLLLVPPMALLVGSIFYFVKKSFAWILLVFWLVSQIGSTLYLFPTTWRHSFSTETATDPFLGQFDAWIPSFWELLGSALMTVLVLWQMNRADFREQFGLDAKTGQKTLLFTAGLLLLTWFFIRP
ncbi:MAG: hypothetical protein AAF206_14845 [Bacteroidota bacterium]